MFGVMMVAILFGTILKKLVGVAQFMLILPEQ
jgi:hypothetical protein